MTGDPRILELLEKMLETGQSAEEVCRDCPELLAEVKERWKRFGSIDSELGALFPASEESAGGHTSSPVEDEGPPARGEPTLAGPSGSLEKLLWWVRRHPGLTITVLGIVLAALALLVAGLLG